MRWTDEDDERLCNAVRQYRHLYDTSSALYSDRNAVDNAWSEISTLFAGEDVKRRWKQIRDRYVRNQKKWKESNKSGAGRQTFGYPAILTQLGWLGEYIRHRTTEPNFVSVYGGTAEGSILEENEDDSSVALMQQVDGNHCLSLKVKDLEKKLEDKERSLAEANKVIRTLRATILTLAQQLKQHERLYQNVFWQQNIDSVMRTTVVETPNKSYTSRIPVPSCTESYSSSTTEQCPNLILSCTSDDDGADFPSPSDDEVVRASHQVQLGNPFIKLDDVGHLVETNGIFKMAAENRPRENNGDRQPDDGDDDEDNDGGDDCGTVRDTDYDPANESDSCSANEDPSYVPTTCRKTRRANSEKGLLSTPEKQQHICGECGKDFPSLNELLQHQRTHSNPEVDEEKSVCSLCEKVFSHRRTLLCHLRSAHQLEMVHECSQCQEKFETFPLLQAHKKTHTEMNECETESNKGPCVCTKCNKHFKHKHSLKEHQKWCGTEPNVWPYSCSKCHKRFKVHRHMKGHQIRCGRDENETPDVIGQTVKSTTAPSDNVLSNPECGPLTCTKCNKKFGNEVSLKNHRTRCVRNLPFQCTKCPHLFTSWSYFKVHMQIHTGEKPFSCPWCPKTFAIKNYLRLHKLIHTKSYKKYQCQQCGKLFQSKMGLKIHERIHTGEKPFTCSHCKRPFRRYSQLCSHLRTHTGERPYKCSVCDKSFSNASSLKDHARSHSRERPYLCAVCGKAFIRKDSLNAHQRLHTGEKPFSCTACGEKFRHKQTMWAHEKSEHNIDRSYPCSWCEKIFASFLGFKSHVCVGPGHEQSADPEENSPNAADGQ